MIQMMAKCDGPMCDKTADARDPRHPKPQYPDNWTLVTVNRSRIQGLAAREHGFCSGVCFAAWADLFGHRMSS